MESNGSRGSNLLLFFLSGDCKTALFPGVGKQTESSIQNRDFWGLIFSVGSEGWKDMPDYGVMQPDRRHAALCGSVFCKMEESS